MINVAAGYEKLRDKLQKLVIVARTQYKSYEILEEIPKADENCCESYKLKPECG